MPWLDVLELLLCTLILILSLTLQDTLQVHYLPFLSVHLFSNCLKLIGAISLICQKSWRFNCYAGFRVITLLISIAGWLLNFTLTVYLISLPEKYNDLKYGLCSFCLNLDNSQLEYKKYQQNFINKAF